VYRSAPIVANICVYAAEDRQKPVAIIVPAEPALKKLASEQGVKGEHLEELVNDKKLNSAVLKQLQDAGRKGGLAGFETIEGVVMADEEWTPQNVSLTPASSDLRHERFANKCYRVLPPRPRNLTARAYCSSTRRRLTRLMVNHHKLDSMFGAALNRFGRQKIGRTTRLTDENGYLIS
jgi:hypothetical protein